jgi:large subunit ribosomal protein L21
LLFRFLRALHANENFSFPTDTNIQKMLEENMYAVISTGGKQYQVAQGERIRVEKLSGAVGDTVEIDEVLLVSDGEEVKVGQPMVEGAKVLARIIEQDRAKKIVVFKKKRRKGYRRKQGHRQPFTALEIQEISA